MFYEVCAQLLSVPASTYYVPPYVYNEFSECGTDSFLTPAKFFQINHFSNDVESGVFV